MKIASEPTESDNSDLEDLARVMGHIFASGDRLRLVRALRDGPASVSTVAESLKWDRARVKRELSALRRASIVSTRLRDRETIFVLDAPAVVYRILRSIDSDPRGWR